MGFDIAISNVLMTLLYILPGYVACKTGKVGAAHLPGLSGVLVYACAPFMVFSTLLSLEFSMENLIGMAQFFVATLVFQGLFMAILYAVFRRRYTDARYRILTIGSVLGNVGFFWAADHPRANAWQPGGRLLFGCVHDLHEHLCVHHGHFLSHRRSEICHHPAGGDGGLCPTGTYRRQRWRPPV